MEEPLLFLSECVGEPLQTGAIRRVQSHSFIDMIGISGGLSNGCHGQCGGCDAGVLGAEDGNNSLRPRQPDEGMHSWKNSHITLPASVPLR